MTNGTAGISNEEILRQHLEKVRLQERWLFSQKPKGTQSLYAMNENVADNSADIIDTINRRNKLQTLHKALAQLEDSDKTVITEFYFGSNLSKAELARLHSVSRPTYNKMLKRAINHLRVIFMSIYEEF